MDNPELIAYQRLKEEREKKKTPIDDGTYPSKVVKSAAKKIAKIAKKKVQTTIRGSLSSANMLYNSEEKRIQQFHYDGFTAKVLIEKGEVTIADELIINLLSYACIRVYRKSRLESKFERPFDRSMSQDPVAQVLSCMKLLGLKTVKSEKDIANKLLGNDAEELNGDNSVPSFAEWKESEKSKNNMRIVRRAETDFGVNPAFYSTPGSENNENEEDIDDIMPSFK